MRPQAYGNFNLQEENDEMMAVAVDPSTNTIPYELFINQLMVSSGNNWTLVK